jgi:murein L,D-transpeptidase YafK
VVLALLGLVELVSRPMIAKLVVSKSARQLTAYDRQGRVLKVWPAAIGRSPIGHKQLEGDERTPEGEYYVCVKNPQSRFHLSLGLSYPSVADAERGLADGLIDETQYTQIAEAERLRSTPPWKTALGGEIFIHGEMESRGATAGCVAITNAAMDELFPLVEPGVKVVIEP